MNRNSVTVVTMAIALTVVSISAAAQMDAEDRAEAAAVVKAPITPTQAVQIAEQSGGRAYALGMESSRHGNWYEVEVLRNNVPTEVRISPVSGKVLGSSKAHGEDAADAHALDRSKLTLTAAIARSERAGNGTAMEATSMGNGDHARVIVDIVKDKRVTHYRVWMSNNHMHVSRTSHSAG